MQPPELFCKKSCSKKFGKIQRKTPVPESLFYYRPQTCNVIKKETLTQVFSCEFCKISKNSFFTELFWVTASTCYPSIIHYDYIYFHTIKILGLEL